MERIEVIGLNMAEIQGLGRRKGLTHMWRGIAYGADLLPKTRLEVVVKDGGDLQSREQRGYNPRSVR